MKTSHIRQIWDIIPAYQFFKTTLIYLKRKKKKKGKTKPNQQVPTAQNISMFKEVAVGTQNIPI